VIVINPLFDHGHACSNVVLCFLTFAVWFHPCNSACRFTPHELLHKGVYSPPSRVPTPSLNPLASIPISAAILDPAHLCENHLNMPKPLVDGRRVAQGELHINTAPITGKIPNPIIKLLVRQIQKIVADSGYVNVTVTIK
jgi:hypothetical protein